jgi:cell fate regulator YaaT (PSP1 superfamily)
VQGDRGVSQGVVLCQATARHAQWLGAGTVGQLLRRLSPDDAAASKKIQQREQQMFVASRTIAAKLNLPLEILDSELSLDGRRVILQYLMPGDCDAADLVQAVAEQFDVEVWLENLAAPAAAEEHAEGCGEPNCGKVNGGGCETCSSGGGCSSCGSGGVDIRAYFGHLREKMEASRTPLL